MMVYKHWAVLWLVTMDIYIVSYVVYMIIWLVYRKCSKKASAVKDLRKQMVDHYTYYKPTTYWICFNLVMVGVPIVCFTLTFNYNLHGMS